MISQYNNIIIRGIQAVVPNNVISNMDYAQKIGEKKIKRLLNIIGVQRRHAFVSGDNGTVTGLVIHAANQLLDRLSWDRDEIRVLVYVTQSPEFESPSTALFIQKELNIGSHCLAFDVNLGCSGYVAGLQIVAGLLEGCKNGSKALLLVADDAFLDRKELNDSMLFGDGAAATAIEKTSEASDFSFIQRSDGNRYDALLRKFSENVIMNGEQVFEFSMTDVVKEIADFREYYSIEEEDIDYYVFHQAQKFIIDNIVNELHIAEEKVLISMDEYGNTSCASIPITLCSNDDKYTQDNVRVLLCGFGVGLAWNCVYTTIPKTAIGSVLEHNGLI